MYILIVDTETTGLTRQDQIVEFAGLLVQKVGSRLCEVEQYQGLREPDCPMHPMAMAAHGLSEYELSGQQLDLMKMQNMFSRCDMVVAHNASFDRRFIEPVLPVSSECTWVCSCRGINWKAHGMKNGRLQELIRHHGIDPGRAHRAMSDVVALKKLLEYSQEYLEELTANHCS